MPIADIRGASIHYKDRGEGLPVLGVIGFALDQRYWAAQSPAIARDHRFITFDNRGVGRSTGVIVSSIDELAADALGLLDHLGIEKAVLFGASMGGTIAQRIVLDHPDRVSGLILAVTFARPIEYMRREQEVVKRILESGDFDTYIDASLLHLFTPRFFEIGAETIDRWVRALFAESGPELPSADVLVGQLEAMQKHDVLAELGRISCPTLVVGARYDAMVPAFASEEIAAAIPGARLKLFDSGHAVMIEEMDAFNAEVLGFLAELRRRSLEL